MKKTTGRQQGFLLGYVVFVIALISLLTFYLTKTTRGAGQLQWTQDSKVSIVAQSQLIRSRIIACGINYPAGNNGTGFRVRFPSTPGTGLVSDLTCPGQTGANNLWSGTGGLTLPASPSGFAAWTYANDGTSIRISITPKQGSSDPAAMLVLNSLLTRIGANASLSGATLTITLMA